MFCDPGQQDTFEKEGAQLVCGLELPATMKAKGHKQATWMASPMFRQLHSLDRADMFNGGQERATEFKTVFESAGSLEAAGACVSEALVKKLSTSLAIPTTDIDTARPMHFLRS